MTHPAILQALVTKMTPPTDTVEQYTNSAFLLSGRGPCEAEGGVRRDTGCEVDLRLSSLLLHSRRPTRERIRLGFFPSVGSRLRASSERSCRETVNPFRPGRSAGGVWE